MVCCPLTLTEGDSIGLLSHEPLLTQPQWFDRLTVSVSFHSPACIVAHCTVGVIVTTEKTVSLPKEEKREGKLLRAVNFSYLINTLLSGGCIDCCERKKMFFFCMINTGPKLWVQLG